MSKEEVALIVGASGSLGKALIKELSRDYKLILHCNRHCSELLRMVENNDELRRSVLRIIEWDFTVKPASKFIDEVLKVANEVQVAILLSAIYDETPLELINDELVDRVLRVNLASHIIMTAKLVNAMADSGVIILFSDLIALRDPRVYVRLKPSVPYIVSKAGIIALAKVLAEVVPRRISVIALAPGWIDTDKLSSDLRKDVLTSVPLGRIPSAEDVAKLVLYVIKHSKYLHGSVIEVNSGL